MVRWTGHLLEFRLNCPDQGKNSVGVWIVGFSLMRCHDTFKRESTF